MENANSLNHVQADSPSLESKIGNQFTPLDEKLKELGEILGECKEYDNALEIPEIEGTRIVKCLYQVNKKTGKKVAENSYFRIPTSHLTEDMVKADIDRLAPYLVSFLQEHENALIKADHVKGVYPVYIPALGLDKIVGRLEALELGNKLTKEIIASWFTANMADNLGGLFMDKMGVAELDDLTEDQAAKLVQTVRAYSSKYEVLAGGSAKINIGDCKAMISMIDKCGASESMIGVRLVTRLNKMLEVVADTLELL